jgi:hypothetical protein
MPNTGEIPVVNVNERTTFSWPIVVATGALILGIAEARSKVASNENEMTVLKAEVTALKHDIAQQVNALNRDMTEQKVATVRLEGKVDLGNSKLDSIVDSLTGGRAPRRAER